VTAEPMSDFVRISSSTLIFVHVADREKFEAIRRPTRNQGRRATGHGVLVKTMEQDGFVVVFHHWV
jgi:hypothetical protein